jgi:hypothetical protein
MNDQELDRLLDRWEAPSPSRALREAVRARLPRAEGRVRRFPLRWVLAVAAVSATLAIAMGQGGDASMEGFGAHLMRLHNMFFRWMHPSYGAQELRSKLLRSEPKIYVDGQLLKTPQFGAWRAGTTWVEVPGGGVYLFTSYSGGASGFTEAGKVHGNVLQFRAGSRFVRIECNAPITEDDQSIYVSRRE